MKQIIILLFTILAINSYSQTWEYEQSGNYRFGLVNFSEEYITGKVITLSIIRNFDTIPQEDKMVTSRIKIHDSYTGEVIDSAIYEIDTLSCTLSWIFHSDSLNQYFIVGQARTKNIDSLRGYFLLTKWDEDLNLLSDTLIRLQPFNETYTIWYLVGNQTKKNEYVTIGYQNIDPERLYYHIIEIVVRVDGNGDIEKVKWLFPPQTIGNQRNIFYDDILNKYIIIGKLAYVLNNEFEVEKEIDTPDILSQGYVGLANKFSDEKYLVTAMYNSGYNHGLGFLNRDFNYIKGINISKSKNGIFDQPFARKNYDYIDTSVIYTGNYEINNSHISVAKLNSNLDPYWIKYFSYGDSIFHYLFSITATNDGGFIITGGIGNIKDIIPPDFVPKNLQAWMKKFDANGNSVSTKEIPNRSWEITVFPNPSPSDFKIKIEGNAQNTELQLFDMQCRKIKSFNNLVKGTNNINMYDVPQGIYIWKLEKKGKVLGEGKWIKK